MNLRLLHTENDDIMARMVRLGFPDWDITRVKTKLEAVETIHATGNNFHAVLLDLDLPDNRVNHLENGERQEAIEAFITEIGTLTPAAKAIWTGYDIEWLRPKARELGIYAFITKGSFQFDKIKNAVENAVREWQEERDLLDGEAIRAIKTRYYKQREAWFRESSHFAQG